MLFSPQMWLWSWLGLLLLHVGGVGAVVTGTKYCNAYMCVTGKHDNSTKIDTYTLEPPSGKTIPLASFGWMAIGFGSTMTNSAMVVVWPNSDGSFTLSQRAASSNSMPTVVSNPPRKATLDTSASYSNTSSTSITFTLPANTATDSATNKTSIIWAYGTTNPSSSSASATFRQHLASGNTQLALLSPLTTSTNSSSSGSSSNSTSSSTGTTSGTADDQTYTSSSKKVLVAHVVCGALATMFLLPSGIIIPRIARGLTDSRWWFPVHAAVNGLLAFGLIVAAFGIARSNFHSNGGFGSSHRKLGLTLFILALFQTLLGLFTHFYKRPHRFQTSSGRGPSNFIHMLLGLIVVAIGFGTVWKGIDEEWGRYSGTGNPKVGWKVGWGLIVAITAITYLGGLYFLPRQLTRENSNRRPVSHNGSGRQAYESGEGKSAFGAHTPAKEAYLPPAQAPRTTYDHPPPPPPPPPTRSAMPTPAINRGETRPPPPPLTNAAPPRRMPPPFNAGQGRTGNADYEMSGRL